MFIVDKCAELVTSTNSQNFMDQSEYKHIEAYDNRVL